MDFHGVKMAVTYVSRHFGVYSRKQKKTVLKVWSKIKKKNSLCIHKTPLRKYLKKLKRKTMKTFKIFDGF